MRHTATLAALGCAALALAGCSQETTVPDDDVDTTAVVGVPVPMPTATSTEVIAVPVPGPTQTQTQVVVVPVPGATVTETAAPPPTERPSPNQ